MDKYVRSGYYFSAFICGLLLLGLVRGREILGRGRCAIDRLID